MKTAFRLVADLDGRQRPVRLAPVGTDAGFDLHIEVSDDGGSVVAFTITGRVDGGRRIVRVWQGHALTAKLEFWP